MESYFGIKKGSTSLEIRKSSRFEKEESAGFTLVEVIVATTLIVAIAVGILPLFINSIAVNAEVKRKQIALKFAETKIEEYRTKSFGEILVAQPDPETDPAETFSVPPLTSSKGEVFIYNYDLNDEIKEIKVEVTWQGRRGETNLDMSTLIGQKGLNL